MRTTTRALGVTSVVPGASVVVALALCAVVPVAATAQAHAEHGEAAGTDVQETGVGPELSLSASLLGGWLTGSGPRGQSAGFTTNWVMATAAWNRPALSWGIQVMGSAEAIQGRDGYPLLLQTGETADGQTPLRDRQHPHDALMAFGLWAAGQQEAFDWWASADLVGSPQLGPQAFMHRPAARAIPSAPIGHHFMDATHISQGVLSVGLQLDDRVRLGVSAFNGHEPDQDRWDVQGPDLNAAAFSFGFDPVPGWSVDASFGWLNSPEQLHPGLDVRRLTAQVAHSRPTIWGQLDLLVGLGRNHREELLITVAEARRTFPPGVFAHYTTTGGVSDLPPEVSEEDVYLLFESRVQRAWLGELALTQGGRVLALRVERARKDELFDPLDPRHSTEYNVAKAELGIAQQVLRLGPFALDLGGSAALHRVPPELQDAYGSRTPSSLSAFAALRLGTHQHSMH